MLLVPRIEGSYAGIGVLGRVEQVGRLADGDPGALIRGRRRVRIGSGTTGPGAALWVEGTVVEEDAESGAGGEAADAGTPPAEVSELMTEYKALAADWLRKRGAWQVVDRLQQIDDVEPARRQRRILAVPLHRAEDQAAGDHRPGRAAALRRRPRCASTSPSRTSPSRSRKDVQEGMDKQQREFLLRRQLDAVRKELAELNGDPEDEGEDYRARVEAADLPEKVRKAALKEVDKLERSSDQSPEGGWIRTWLDTVLEMPWNERTEDAYDIAGAQAVLDADHAGPRRTSRSASPSTWPCASGATSAGSASSAGGAAARCWPWSGRPASARPRSASPSRARWGASSSASRSAASGTRRRSAATGVRTSARCPAGSSGPSRRPVR